MTLEVETAAPEDTMQTAAQMMADGGVGVLPLCDCGRLVGMITDRDITVRAVAEGRAPDECSVTDVITEDLNYPSRTTRWRAWRKRWGNGRFAVCRCSTPRNSCRYRFARRSPAAGPGPQKHRKCG
jgi:CBS domain-containing protein